MAQGIDGCLALLSDHLEKDDDRGSTTYHRDLLQLLLEHDFDSQKEEKWFYVRNVSMTIAVIICVAVVAGLFLGLMTMDAFQLQIVARSSLDEDERRHAEVLYPVVVDRHRLLVTLLILNALAYETLPLFLDKMVPGWLAIVLSTTLVLLFGEIVPSAIFIG
jgi:sterol desaturase/sphingolipid hydroxylase (fatty acid hydroxylase superfamily)